MGVHKQSERALLEAEPRGRLELPLGQWEPVGSVDDLFLEAWARIGSSRTRYPADAFDGTGTAEVTRQRLADAALRQTRPDVVPPSTSFIEVG